MKCPILYVIGDTLPGYGFVVWQVPGLQLSKLQEPAFTELYHYIRASGQCPVCKYGIFGVTPEDFMHVFKQGILKHCSSLFMDSLTDTQKTKLDSMAAYLYKNYCQTVMWQYPRVDFSNGLTNLKQKTADEETGATFVVCAVVHCEEAFKMIAECTKRVEDQLNTSEMLLCFEQWCCCKTFWAIEQEAACKQCTQDAVIVLMESIKASFMCGVDEADWHLAKFHQLIHRVEGIAKFRVPENTSATKMPGC